MERRGNRGQVLVWGTVGALAVLLVTWAINSIHAGNRPALPGPALAPAKPPKAAVKKREDAGSTTVSGTTLPSFAAASSQEAVQGTTPRVGFNVAFHSGEFIYPFSAGHLKGISAHNDRNMDVNLLFTHRSGITWNGYFGYNWDFYYFKRVVERDVGGGTLELDYYDGMGRKDTFAGWDNTNKEWDTNPVGYFGKFQRSTYSGNIYQYDRYTYTDIDGFKLTFDDDGRLYRMTDRNGNFIQVTYDGTYKFRINKLRDTTYDASSRELSFAYGSLGRLYTITDYKGRVIELHYDNNTDDLWKIDLPDPESSGANPRVHTFTYDSHKLSVLNNPNSDDWLENTYSSGKVIQQDWGGEIIKICHYTGGSPNETRVLDGNGHRMHYIHRTSAPTNVPAQKVEYTKTWTLSTCDFSEASGKLRSGDPDTYTTEYSWNSHSQLTNVKYPRGNATKYLFDTTYTWAVAQVVRKENDSDSDSDADNLITAYEYVGNFGQVKTVKDPNGYAAGTPYATTYIYDFEEATLGDQNGDGVTTGTNGNLVRINRPNVTVGLAATQDNIWEKLRYRSTGQLTKRIQKRDASGTYSEIETDDTYYTTTGSGALKDFLQKRTDNAAGPSDDKPETSFEYNEVGLVTKMTDGLGKVWLYVFDEADRLTTETKPPVSGSTSYYYTTYTYDPWDLLTVKSVSNAIDNVLQSNGDWTTIWEYNLRRLKTKETVEVDPAGASQSTWPYTDFVYDGHFNLQDVKVLDPAPNPDEVVSQTRTVWDERNLTFTSTRGYNDTSNPSLASTVQRDYDGNGNPTKITDGRGSSYHKDFTYDNHDRPTRATDEAGHYRDFTYDKNGNRLSEKAYDATSTPEMVHRTEALYDELNRRYEERRFRSDSGSDHVDTKTKYDRLGNVVEVQGASCACANAKNMFDGLNRRTKAEDYDGNSTEYLYDKVNNVLRITENEKDGGSTLSYKTHQAWNAARQLTQVDVEDKDNSAILHTTAYQRDGRNLVTEITDAESNKTNFTYDGRAMVLTKKIDNRSATDEEVETFIYDVAGRVDQRKDDNDVITKYKYDALNRQKEMYLAYVSDTSYGTKYTYARDKNDHVTTYKVFTYSSGDVLRLQIDSTYGARNELTLRDLTNGLSVGNGKDTYLYDALGRVTEGKAYANNDSTVIADTDLTWNWLDQKTGEQQTLLSGTARAYSLEYNADGALTRVTYPNGDALVITRTQEHMIDKIALDPSGAPNEGDFVDYTYYGASRVKEIAYFDNGTPNVSNPRGKQVFTYDGFRRATDISHKDAAETPGNLLQLKYDWDKVRNPKYEKNEGAGTYDLFTYNNGYRITQAGYTSTTTTMAQAATSEEFLYGDDIGNRSDVKFYTAGSQTSRDYYCTNSLNQATRVSTTQVTCPGTATHTYDNLGNLATVVGQWAYTFDFKNRLIKVENTTGNNPVTVGEYAYDAFGRRVQRLTGGGGTDERLYYVGQQIFEKRKIVSSTEKLTHRWAYGNGIDEPLVMWRDTSNPLDETLDAVSYFNRNQLGNVRVMTKWSGSAVVKEEQYEYKAFGAITIKDGSGGSLSTSAIGNPFTFTGREFDAESGLYHYRARAMHPGLGRFMQRDPLFSIGSMNLCEYVLSRPTTLVDLFGLDHEPFCLCARCFFEWDDAPPLPFPWPPGSGPAPHSPAPQPGLPAPPQSPSVPPRPEPSLPSPSEPPSNGAGCFMDLGTTCIGSTRLEWRLCVRDRNFVPANPAQNIPPDMALFLEVSIPLWR